MDIGWVGKWAHLTRGDINLRFFIILDRKVIIYL